jgi:hypothetical protein
VWARYTPEGSVPLKVRFLLSAIPLERSSG